MQKKTITLVVLWLIVIAAIVLVLVPFLGQSSETEKLSGGADMRANPDEGIVHRPSPLDGEALARTGPLSREPSTVPPNPALTGIVLSKSHEPVEGALVQLLRNDAQKLTGDLAELGQWDVLFAPRETAQTRSGPDGRFFFDIEETGTFSIHAEKAGIGTAGALVVHVPSKTEIDLVLRPSSGIPGRVIDMKTGEGIADATIAALISNGDPADGTVFGVVRTKSSRDGSFRIPIYETDASLSIETRIRARGYATPFTNGIWVFEGKPDIPFYLVKMKRGRTLRITLVPQHGGAAPVGVKVLLKGPKGGYFVYQADTDANGGAVIEDFSVGTEARVFLKDDSWALDTTGTPEIDRNVAFQGFRVAIPDSFGDVGVTIPVVEAGSVSGKVVDSQNGQPVEGVRVEVGRFPEAADYGGLRLAPGSKVAVTDHEGRFEVKGLWRTRTFVRVLRDDNWCNWPAGWQGEPVAANSFTWDRFCNPVDLASHARQEIVVHARRTSALSGRVVDQEGRPVRGAVVFEEIDPRDWRQSSERWLIEKRTVRTDEGGRFILRGLSPVSTFQVQIRHPDFLDRTAGPFALKPGGLLDAGNLVLERGPLVTIEAVGPSGPLRGVKLLLTPIARGLRRPLPHDRTRSTVLHIQKEFPQE